MACRLDSGEIKPLLQPIEFMMLEELGYSHEQATKDQRLLWVTNVVCDTCGHTAERHDASPRESCLVYIAILALSNIPCIWLLPIPWGFFAGIGVFYLLATLYTSIERYLIRDAQKLLPCPPVCPNCENGKYKPFSKISGKKSVCYQCGERSMEYEFYAIDRSPHWSMEYEFYAIS